MREYSGREVKHLGDGIMATFLSAANAVDCTISIQKAFAADNQQHPDATICASASALAGRLRRMVIYLEVRYNLRRGCVPSLNLTRS